MTHTQNINALYLRRSPCTHHQPRGPDRPAYQKEVYPLQNRSTVQSRVIPSMCEHLVETGPGSQPLALLALDHDIAGYYCPSCLAAEVELLIDHLQPAEIGAAIHFNKCDHSTGHCSTCEIASTAALQQTWARVLFTDRPKANRIGRLLRLLAHRYDRAGLRDIGAEESAAPPEFEYSSRMLRSESLMGDRARARQRWEDGRVQRKQTLIPPAHTVRVISPADRTAIA